MAKADPKPALPPWRNRIVDSGMVDAAELHGNPANARRHPEVQRAALRGVLREVGWVGRVLVNRTTGLIVDGHLRVEEAAKRGEQVPVDWVELDPAEEALILASFDPIGALAETDQAALDALLEQVESADADVLELIGRLHSDEDDLDDFGDGDPKAGDTRYELVVTCTDETQQRDLLDRFEAEGLVVRAVVI